jgi:hypothetical protein
MGLRESIAVSLEAHTVTSNLIQGASKALDTDFLGVRWAGSPAVGNRAN